MFEIPLLRHCLSHFSLSPYTVPRFLCRPRPDGTYPSLKDISESVGFLWQFSSFHVYLFLTPVPQNTRFIQLNFTTCLCVFVGSLSLPFFCFKSVWQGVRRGGFAVGKRKPNMVSEPDGVIVTWISLCFEYRRKQHHSQWRETVHALCVWTRLQPII